jgi:hypothetical protein
MRRSRGVFAMVAPPQDRFEIVFLADQQAPIHFWVQLTTQWAKRIEFDKDKSSRVFVAAILFLLLALYLFPAATVMLVLIAAIILFPLSLVGMAGYYRGA